MKKEGFMSLINKKVFFPPAIFFTVVVILGAVFPEGFGSVCNTILGFITEKLGWLFVVGAIILLIFCFWAGFSKYGKIKLGGPKAKPKMTMFQWFAVSFTSSLAIGVSYWCVAEPMTYFPNPPTFLGLDGGTVEAAEAAMRYSYLHWSLVPFAIYSSAGIAIAFMFYNAKRPFRVSSALYPILGDRSDGNIGSAVDCIAIFAMVGGIATSLGLGTMQIAGGLEYAFGIDSGIVTLTIIIVVMTVIYTFIATTGVHNGIKHVGTFNMYLYFALLIFVFVCSPMRSIVENIIEEVGDYLFNFIPMVTETDPIRQTGWSESWTIFYWAWWLAFAPLTGLFMVRLAEGRTVRQFVIVNLIAPSSFIFIWFGTFGTAGIFSDMFDGTNIGAQIQELGSSIAGFALLHELPVPIISSIVLLILIALSFNTQAEAVSYTLSSMTTVGFDEDGNEKEPPKAVTVFWGVAMAVFTLIMLYTGGTDSLNAVQTSVVVVGLPIVFLQIIMAYSYYKGMKKVKELDKVGTFDDPKYAWIADNNDNDDVESEQAAEKN